MVPYSVNSFDVVMRDMLALVAPDRVIDFGPGAGKYGKMLRDLEADIGKRVHLTAVEVDKLGVIEKFELDTIYDEIIHDNAVNIIRRFPALTTEVAVMGDFIEHLTKSEGRDLIEYLQYRCRHIFLVIPVDWVSFDWEGRPAESHVAIWRPVDFNAFEGAYAIERKHLDENGEHRFVLAVVNGIRVPLDDHFVVVDDPDETRPFGYLNAPHQERPKWQLPDGY